MTMARTGLALAVASLGVVAAAQPAGAAEVVRHIGNPQSPILSGVTVPGGTTLVMLSGQVPPAVDSSKPADSIDAYGDTKTQTVGVLKRIEGLLVAQGLGMGDVVRMTVFLVGDPKLGGKMDFKGFSEGYAQFFGTAAQPNKVARSTVQVAALASPAFLVEIEVTAVGK